MTNPSKIPTEALSQSQELESAAEEANLQLESVDPHLALKALLSDLNDATELTHEQRAALVSQARRARQYYGASKKSPSTKGRPKAAKEMVQLSKEEEELLFGSSEGGEAGPFGDAP